MKSAEDTRQDVLDELVWDTSLDAAAIGVAVTNGAVTLTGHVGSYAQKRAAEKAAKRVEGVLAVANELEVRLPSALRRDDTDIAAAVAAALEWNVSVPTAVTATVEKGWVMLDGEVDWAHQRRAAENAVRDLLGVRGVTNVVRIRPKVVARAVEDQIHKAFHRSAQIDADHVRVEVSGSKVTLTGTVRSWSERKEAEHAARTATGVTEVENRLRIASLVTPIL
jgi:osmotically-inducible protein OsmY